MPDLQFDKPVKKQDIHFYIDEETVRTLDRLCREHKKKRPELLKSLVQFYLEHR